MTSRNWCFTINNPEQCPLPITEDIQETIKILVYQEEQASTRHLQGYLECVSPVRLSQLKKIFPTAHFEQRKGSRLQAVQYVTKEESRVSGPYFYHHHGKTLNNYLQGLTKTSSNSSKLGEIKALLDGGSSEQSIAEEHFDSWVRHYKAFREYKLLKTQPRTSFEKLIVVLGPTGTGKSRFVLEQYPDAYWKQRSNWWDGYSGQKNVVLDEYYGWLPYDLLLRLCDRYPLLLEVKGGQVQCGATNIIITSNLSPSDWYQKGYKPALYRRITTILYMPKLGETQHFLSMEAFINANITIN